MCIQDIVLSYRKYFQCGSSKHAIKSIYHVTIRNKYKVLIKRFDYLLYMILEYAALKFHNDKVTYSLDINNQPYKVVFKFLEISIYQAVS